MSDEHGDLKADFQIFESCLGQWLEDHLGQYVVMHNGQVIGFFDEYASGLRAGLKAFGVKSEFLVQQVCKTAGGEAMTREQAERERLLDEFAYELAEQLKQRHITIKGAIREAFRQGEQSGMIEATPAAGWELEAAREGEPTVKLRKTLSLSDETMDAIRQVQTELTLDSLSAAVDRIVRMWHYAQPVTGDDMKEALYQFRQRECLYDHQMEDEDILKFAAIIRKHAQGGKQ